MRHEAAPPSHRDAVSVYNTSGGYLPMPIERQAAAWAAEGVTPA